MVLMVTGTASAAVAAEASSPNRGPNEKTCQYGVYAGRHTSCAIANALFRKVKRDDENIADGKRIRVKSPVTGRSYAFFLYRADAESFTCRAYGDGVLTVRIIT